MSRQTRSISSNRARGCNACSYRSSLDQFLKEPREAYAGAADADERGGFSRFLIVGKREGREDDEVTKTRGEARRGGGRNMSKCGRSPAVKSHPIRQIRSHAMRSFSPSFSSHPFSFSFRCRVTLHCIAPSSSGHRHSTATCWKLGWAMGLGDVLYLLFLFFFFLSQLLLALALLLPLISINNHWCLIYRLLFY